MDIEKIIREYIEPLAHMSLATVADNVPWVCEVHFACDDSLNIYFMSLTSRRHSQEIARNPRVAGNIVRQFALGEAPVGVYFEGSAKMLESDAEQKQALAALQQKLGVGDEALQKAKQPDGHKFYKISVDNWYVFGKFGGPSSEKHKLAWNGGQK
jgi:uncharacterized protein YhbP (UPF0306 family)